MEKSTPPAGSARRSWPWGLWAALVGVFLVALGYVLLRPPVLEFSQPKLTFHDGGSCTVDFEATYHGERSTFGEANVILEVVTGASDTYPPTCVEVARQRIYLSLTPGISKSIICEFPASTKAPVSSSGRVEIASIAPGGR